MQIGVNTFLTDEGIGPAELARAVEGRGFDALLLAEHSHIPVSRLSPHPSGESLSRKFHRTLDPFVALSVAALATNRILLGTAVALQIQRDVIHTANQVASLDVVSGGRAVFGVGVGWNRAEMANHGTDPARRGALLDEQLAALRAIWTSEQAEFHGDFVNFDPLYLWPKPVQQPHPPIYVGGGSAATLRRAARFGGWLPHAVQSPDEVRPQLDRLAEQAGRDDVPVSVNDGSPDEEVLAAYAEAGVERFVLALPTLPYDETLTILDEFARATERYR